MCKPERTYTEQEIKAINATPPQRGPVNPELAVEPKVYTEEELDELNAIGRQVRERQYADPIHDDDILRYGAVYSNDGSECPNCGEPNFRAVGDGKFECGNCDWYMEY